MKSVIKPLSRALTSGRISARELTERYISAIERDDPALNAYVLTTFDEARAQADEADRLIRSGEASPLTGIPMTLKDNIVTEGIETTCCSKILRGYKPCYDAAVWEKLKKAGAVLLGKTNMDEFAMGSTSETSCYGAPGNPRDLSRVTGGSSGGGAAAVSGNLAAYALGSDTGGSVRQPAAFCGAVGFKPTYGAVSRYGLIAYGSSLDQIGGLTSSVTDAAIVFDAIKGRDVRDMTSADCAGATRLTGDISGLKIGVAGQFFDGLDSRIAQAAEAAVRFYERGGAKIVNVDIPALRTALPVYYIIACAEASSNLGRYDGIRYGYRAEAYCGVDDMVVKTRTQGFGEEVQKRIMLGTYVLSSGYFDAYYKKACKLRGQIKAEFERVFSECDVLFAPTVPNIAFPMGYSGGNAVETYLSDVCTVPANICGLPAISIPCGEADGMPVGLQIMGRAFDDGRVLDTAYYAEREELCALPAVPFGVDLGDIL